MFVRKTPGPRTVTLPDGSILTMADLPSGQERWVARRKAVVVRAIEHGLLSRDDAKSEEERDVAIPMSLISEARLVLTDALIAATRPLDTSGADELIEDNSEKADD